MFLLITIKNSAPSLPLHRPKLDAINYNTWERERERWERGARSIVKETMYMPFTDNPLKELACTVDSSLIFFVIWHVHISFVKWKYLIFNPAKILIIKIHWSVEYIIIFIGYCFGFFFFEHISTKKNSN